MKRKLAAENIGTTVGTTRDVDVPEDAIPCDATGDKVEMTAVDEAIEGTDPRKPKAVKPKHTLKTTVEANQRNRNVLHDRQLCGRKTLTRSWNCRCAKCGQQGLLNFRRNRRLNRLNNLSQEFGRYRSTSSNRGRNGGRR